MPSGESSLTIESFKKRLRSKRQLAVDDFSKRHPQASDWLLSAGITVGNIRSSLTKLAATGMIAGSLLAFSPPLTSADLSLTDSAISLIAASDLRNRLAKSIKELLPDKISDLSKLDEQSISVKVREILGVDAKFELEDQRLNHQYGWMGAEQHLMRFPGDSVPDMAPKTGAWGYFAKSRNDFNDESALREKYYVAVQTLYLPEWNKDYPVLKEWYKYRKVLVVNPNSGRSVVAVIADAGPANWTGKQFGGSPEVMEHLEYVTGKRKGPVILMFVDDPQNKIKLGPVEKKYD
ncbi:hypothetical protein HZB78_01240 [Candidatus Collierbacteria bacterium]|nr:hypothetical protein [Candidatus Collierbacteria bacterium]